MVRHQVLHHISQFAPVSFLALVFQVILKREIFIIPHTRNISTSYGEGKSGDMKETKPLQSVAILFVYFILFLMNRKPFNGHIFFRHHILSGKRQITGGPLTCHIRIVEESGN